MSTERIMDYIKANPGATKTTITDGTGGGIKGLQLHNILKKLINDGQLSMSGEGNEATYTAVEAPSSEVSVANEPNEPVVAPEGGQTNDKTPDTNENQPPVETEAGKTNSQVTSKASTSRNNDKFSFNGLDGLGKGPLCREFLKAVAADNPGITMKKLNDLVPQSLIPRFGLYEEVETARKVSGQKYDRYFFKEEHVIKLKDKKIVVCNQLTTSLISGVIAKAKELGYTIR